MPSVQLRVLAPFAPGAGRAGRAREDGPGGCAAGAVAATGFEGDQAAMSQAAMRLFSRSRARHRRERIVPMLTFSFSAASW